MDHLEVVRLKAAEKYALGELPPDLREEYEDHYIDCAECTRDLKALATFVTASQMVFQERAVSKAPLHGIRTEPASWFSWLRPAIAVPAIAALAAIVIFQSTVTIPSAKERATSQGVAQVYETSYRVQATTRGENIVKVSIRPSESFALDFDFTPAQIFHSYKGNLVDSSGQAVLTFDLEGEKANKEVHLVIPGGKVHPGEYELVFSGDNGTVNQSPKANEVQRFAFAVEFRP